MTKTKYLLIYSLLALIWVILWFIENFDKTSRYWNINKINLQEKKIKTIKPIEIPKLKILTDIDKDWINDIDDLLEWGRSEVKNKTNYKSSYYIWGYPPNNEWVCTDVIRKAFQNTWINLKDLLDKDIKKNLSKYPRVNNSPDPNIDFRRVPNLDIFFKRNAIILTNEVIPWDKINLEKWQWWDIVIFGKPKDHIAIISDLRNPEWVPYIIHNSAPTPREDDWLVLWSTEVSPIIGHYRWKY